MSFCANCGTKLTEGNRFCPGCGRPVNGTATVVTAHTAAEQPDAAPAQEYKPRAISDRFYPDYKTEAHHRRHQWEDWPPFSGYTLCTRDEAAHLPTETLIQILQATKEFSTTVKVLFTKQLEIENNIKNATHSLFGKKKLPLLEAELQSTRTKLYHYMRLNADIYVTIDEIIYNYAINPVAHDFMIKALRSSRAYTLQQAVNLYEQQRQFLDQQALLEELIAEQKNAASQAARAAKNAGDAATNMNHIYIRNS